MREQVQAAQLRSGTEALGGWTLTRVFLRSLFLQASWNPKGMQNVGFAYALLPALERLHPDKALLTQAIDRHLCCFNTNPYVSGAILGGALYHEERIARGEEPPEAVNTFKAALMGPFAALGDGFFWLSLRPAAGALSVLLAIFFGLWGALFYLVSYNVVHLALRARLFLAGWRKGDGVVEVVAASRLPWYGERLRVVAAGCVGVTAGLASVAAPAGSVGGRGWMVGAWALFIGCYGLLGKGLSPYALAYGALAFALGVGLMLG